MEVVATAMAGTNTIATAKAIKYSLWQNLDRSPTEISVGMTKFGEEDNTIKVIKIVIFDDVWSPTITVGLGEDEENVIKLGNWLHQLSEVYWEEEDNIDEYIEEE
jgi:hypothetical protein